MDQVSGEIYTKEVYAPDKPIKQVKLTQSTQKYTSGMNTNFLCKRYIYTFKYFNKTVSVIHNLKLCNNLTKLS